MPDYIILVDFLEPVIGNITVETAPVPESPLETDPVTSLPDTKKKPPIKVVVKTESIQNHYTTTNELPGDVLRSNKKEKPQPPRTQTGKVWSKRALLSLC